MDPKQGLPALLAPGASPPGPAHCPAADPGWPEVDDHLVEPEVTRHEIVRGVQLMAPPALEPHADQQSRLDYLLQAHVRPGYVVSTELLTRVAPRSDFATDVCVRKAGQDPRTGRRFLEELAFEVVSEQSLTGRGSVTEKAEDMAARGVRRVFALIVKAGVVKEWRGGWRALPHDGAIEDQALARPLLVRAILDAAEADDAVARALLAKGNRVLAELEDRGRKEGIKEGLAEGLRSQQETLLGILGARGIALPGPALSRVRACADLATLQRWTIRAALASSPEDVFSSSDEA
jgi:hypothetical protein